MSKAIATNNRMMGLVKGDTLVLIRHGSKHLLKFPRPSWAIDRIALEKAKASGAIQVELTDREDGRIYSSSIANLERLGVPMDRGYGLQIALELRHWTTNDKPSLRREFERLLVTEQLPLLI